MAKWLKRIALMLLVLVVGFVLMAWWLIRGSLPTLDGNLSLPGLLAPVTIQRDHLGVVTIDAVSEVDAMRALGYVHAQERFFEMDLMRRTAAGELAELFGPIAVDTDKQHRVHRMRARVMENLTTIAGDKMDVLEAYVDGVNAGLTDLKVRPWPYLLLRTEPQPWLLADTPLVGYAMYFDLQDSTNKRELALWRIKQVVPPALFALLARDGTSWDAPLMGQPRGDAVLPDAATLDLRKLAALKHPRELTGLIPPSREVGSNNFAVSGALTKDGRAIVADDMHLTLRAPNIWFRTRLRYADVHAVDGKVDVSGFTLPGLPLVVVGSNGHVAWGFTNSYGDWADWAKSPPCRPFSSCVGNTEHHEKIAVAGAEPIDFPVRETFWGPVLHTEPDGSTLALRWAGQLPEGLQLSLADLARADSLMQALDAAALSSIPVQNLLVADRSGRIGWQLLGALPQRDAGCDRMVSTKIQRFGFEPPLPGQKHDGGSFCTPWAIDHQHIPRLADPASHRLWTANNRTLDGDTLKQVGDGGYALGARAKQIRDDLFAKQQFTERDLLAIQLDDRALFLQRWWQLLHEQTNRANSPALRELADASRKWQGRASAGSVSYRIVKAWRLAVLARILDGLTAPAQAALGKDFVMPDLPQFEGVAWPLVTQRPDNLLPRRFATWDALFEDAAVEVRDELAKQGPLTQRTWGERNIARICHPLSMALPSFARRLLCMPFDQLDGDSNMPRVAAPDFGVSERMVVSPGHEADGIIHMPGGQSGHPLSPFWGAGHEAWVHGRPTPFLPGKAEYTLLMTPTR
ncbi:MAG TPA: penicillin acylase family protein [Luteimonas sp.]|nr:penicillin acylase family protein [Luteimonas sp.]